MSLGRVPPEVVDLFEGLTGMQWPMMDPARMYELAGVYHDTANSIMTDLPELFDKGVGTLTEHFRMSATDPFVQSMAQFTTGEPNYLAQLAQAASDIGDFVAKTAADAEYTKLMIIAQLVELLIEIAFAIFMAECGFFEWLFNLTIEYLISREFIVTALRWLFETILQHVVLGVATGVAMDRIIQRIQKDEGHRSDYDNSLLLQAVEYGVIGGVLAGPLGKLGAGLGKGIGNLVGKDVTKLLGDAIGTAFRGAFGTGLSEGVTKALAGDLAKAFEHEIPQLLKGFADGGARLAGNLADAFDKHLGDLIGGDAARELGRAYAEALAAHWGRDGLETALRDAVHRVADRVGGEADAVLRGESTMLSKHLPDAIRSVLKDSPDGTIRYRAGAQVGEAIGDWTHGNLSEGFYNLIFDPSHEFHTNWITGASAAAMSRAHHLGHWAANKIGDRLFPDRPSIPQLLDKYLGLGSHASRPVVATTGGRPATPTPEPSTVDAASPAPVATSTAPSVHHDVAPPPRRVPHGDARTAGWERTQQDLANGYDAKFAERARVQHTVDQIRPAFDKSFTEWARRRLDDGSVHTLADAFGIPRSHLTPERLAEVRDRAMASITDRVTRFADTTPESVLDGLNGEFDRQAVRVAGQVAADHLVERHFAGVRQRVTGGEDSGPPVLSAEATTAIREKAADAVRSYVDSKLETVLTPGTGRDLAARTADALGLLQHAAEGLQAKVDLETARLAAVDEAAHTFTAAVAEHLGEPPTPMTNTDPVTWLLGGFREQALSHLKRGYLFSVGDLFDAAYGDVDPYATPTDRTGPQPDWNSGIAELTGKLPGQLRTLATWDKPLAERWDQLSTATAQWRKRARTGADDLFRRFGLDDTQPGAAAITAVRQALFGALGEAFRSTYPDGPGSEPDPVKAAEWDRKVAAAIEALPHRIAWETARETARREADTAFDEYLSSRGLVPLGAEALDRAKSGFRDRVDTAFAEHFSSDGARSDARGFADHVDRLTAGLDEHLAFESDAAEGLAHASAMFDRIASRHPTAGGTRHDLAAGFREDWFHAFHETWAPKDGDAQRWLTHEAGHENTFQSVRPRTESRDPYGSTDLVRHQRPAVDKPLTPTGSEATVATTSAPVRPPEPAPTVSHGDEPRRRVNRTPDHPASPEHPASAAPDLTTTRDQPPTDPASSAPTGRGDGPSELPVLSQVLPEDEWWRLYINPEDHETALRLYPHDPGSLYDHQNSPGFQQSMVNAYRQVLDTPGSTRLDADGYEQLHQLVTAHLASSASKYDFTKWSTGLGAEFLPKAGAVSFGLNRDTISADAREEILAGRVLLYDLADFGKPGRHREMDQIVSYVSHHKGHIVHVAYRRAEAKHLVGAALDRFYVEIDTAVDATGKLRAIARAVRALQVIHPFTDTNGRLNIHLILPKLLLDHGFRPVVPDNMTALFNGGYSIDEIVTELQRTLAAPMSPAIRHALHVQAAAALHRPPTPDQPAGEHLELTDLTDLTDLTTPQHTQPPLNQTDAHPAPSGNPSPPHPATASTGAPVTPAPQATALPAPSQWHDRRLAAPVSVVVTERFDPDRSGNPWQPLAGQHPSMRGLLDGSATRIRYELRRIEVAPGQFVREYTVPLHVVGVDPRVGAGQLAELHARLTEALDTTLNRRYRFADGDQLHVRVEFREPEPGQARPAHLTTVTVDDRRPRDPGYRPTDQTHWHLHEPGDVLVHEILHYLGAKDEYADITKVFRTPGGGSAALDRVRDTVRTGGLMDHSVRTGGAAFGDHHLKLIDDVTRASVEPRTLRLDDPGTPRTQRPSSEPWRRRGDSDASHPPSAMMPSDSANVPSEARPFNDRVEVDFAEGDHRIHPEQMPKLDAFAATIATEIARRQHADDPGIRIRVEAGGNGRRILVSFFKPQVRAAEQRAQQTGGERAAAIRDVLRKALVRELGTHRLTPTDAEVDQYFEPPTSRGRNLPDSGLGGASTRGSASPDDRRRARVTATQEQSLGLHVSGANSPLHPSQTRAIRTYAQQSLERGQHARVRLLIGRLARERDRGRPELESLRSELDNRYREYRQSTLGARPGAVPVPRDIHFVWFGKEMTPAALANLHRWKEAAGGSWNLHLWTDRQYRQWSEAARATVEGLVTVHDDAAEVVRRVGGDEVADVFEESLKAGAFNSASNIIRYSVLLERGGAYSDVDIHPGTVRLAELPEVSMRTDDLPVFAPQIRDANSVANALKTDEQVAQLTREERVARAAERLYAQGLLNNNFIMAPPGARLMRLFLEVIPGKFHAFRSRYPAELDSNLEANYHRDFKRNSPSIGGPALLQIGPISPTLPHSLLKHFAMEAFGAWMPDPFGGQQATLEFAEVLTLFEPELLQMWQGLGWLSEESERQLDRNEEEA